MMIEFLKTLLTKVGADVAYSTFQRHEWLVGEIAAFSEQDVLVTLPRLGKAFDKALVVDCASGNLDRLTALSLEWLGCLDRASRVAGVISLGILHPDEDDEPSNSQRAERIYAVRQFLLLLSKLELAVTLTDESLEAFVGRVTQTVTLPVQKRAARALVHHMLYGIDIFNVIPKHGPGAVAEGDPPHLKGHRRLVNQNDWAYGPEFFLTSSMFLEYAYTGEPAFTAVPAVARLVAVPKDFRGPRLICAEPSFNQWIQQGQARAIVDGLERNPITQNRVNFTSQLFNQELALESSQSGKYATLDLKDASDLVRVTHVHELFPDKIRELLMCTRSGQVSLPQGREPVNITTMAPMGSSVCFPVEAVVFYAVAVTAITEVRLGPDGALRKLSSLSGAREAARMADVHVYGDDIIVPAIYAESVMQLLRSFGFLPNESKCCLLQAPSFRESCGVDAWAGVNVTPIKFRHLLDRSKPEGLLGVRDVINNLLNKKLYEAAAFLLSEGCRVYKGRLVVSTDVRDSATCVVDPCGVLRSFFQSEVTYPRKWDRNLQQWRARLCRVTPVHVGKGTENSFLDRAVLDSILGRRADPLGFALPRRVKEEWGWNHVYGNLAIYSGYTGNFTGVYISGPCV